jgi:uncharacterized membrane protein YbaN (DUF454 family)
MLFPVFFLLTVVRFKKSDERHPPGDVVLPVLPLASFVMVRPAGA